MRCVIVALTVLGIGAGWSTPAFAQVCGPSVDEQADAIVAAMKAGERNGHSLTITHQPLDKEIRQLEAARDLAFERGRADEGAFLERKLSRRLELQAGEEASPGPEGTSDRVGALFSSARDEFADEEQYYRSIGREDLAEASAEKLRKVQLSEAVSTKWKDEIERAGAEREAAMGDTAEARRQRLEAMAEQGAGLIPWPVREPASIFRPGAAGSTGRIGTSLSGGVFRPGAAASPTSSPRTFRREATVTRSGGLSSSAPVRPTPTTAPTLPSSFGKRDFRGYTFGGSSSSSSRTFRPKR